MKTITSWKELEGKKIIKQPFWLGRDREDVLLRTLAVDVLSTKNEECITIDESVPYSSSHSVSASCFIKNEQDFEKLLKEKAKDVKLFFVEDGFRYFEVLKFHTKDPILMEEIVKNGFYEEIHEHNKFYITDSLERVVEIFKEKYEEHFFKTDIDPYSMTRKGVNEKYKEIYITPSPRKNYKYQITFLKNNVPFAHINSESKEELEYWIKKLDIKLVG